MASRFLVIVILVFIVLVDAGIAQQIDIPRIEQMPNLPTPYEMRDWKQVTLGYDSLVFDFDREGDYLPLISWMTNTVNYPDHQSIYLHTVVGTPYPFSSEAINVLPAIVGASLVGIDKTTHNGYNWVLFCEEFFNRRPEENVYLNHPVSQSGDDWWYATMPNVFFYQLYSLYPETGDFSFQFVSVADQWLEAVLTMGAGSTPWTIPDIDHRGWYLSTMMPYDDGVHQPEAAGAIGWLLYHAYHETGQEKYRIGAEHSLEFLSEWPTNPSYELQLSYGAYIAARMNAELGTEYDIEKIVNWCFNVGPLRNWGAILGEWGVYDVYGLIGEADGSDYAFAMNTFEQIGALVPLVRYDDRFARAIGKWVLNASNACRLFYPNYLSDLNQDSEAWAHTYDPNSYIAYEALRQHSNGFPFATGDAIDGGWGATNLTLYGSSHVGILGGIINSTNESGILQLDLLKTDYFHDQAYPSYLYYNPYDEEKIIEINTGTGSRDIYDAVQNQIIASGVTGIENIIIPADEALLIVILPAGGSITYDLDKMLVNNVVVDFRAGQSVMNYPPRIKNVAATSETVNLYDSVSVYCTATDKDHDLLSYTWQANGGEIIGEGDEIIWVAPSSLGIYSITSVVADGKSASDTTSFDIEVVERINTIPVIHRISANPRKVDLGAVSEIVCNATDPDGDALTYQWSCKNGLLESSDSVATWTAPATEGDYFILCIIQDDFGGLTSDSINVAVRDLSIIPTGDLIAYYPFEDNANDYSPYENHGSVHGAVSTQDRFGEANMAYLFDGVNDYILVPNSSSLNFQNSISVNFWIKITQFYDDREAYPLSHGNWERRWKFSITNRKVRWTVKTENQVKDVDSELTLSSNTFYNITGVYDGTDFEIYINGKLDNFTHLSGLILTTNVDLTIGQVLPDNSQYNFKGIIDDIRIYNYALSLETIHDLYDLNLGVPDVDKKKIPISDFLEQNYPNPFNASTTVHYHIHEHARVQIQIYDILGRKIKTLVQEPHRAGYYFVIWDGKNENGLTVNSGIYLYELRTENFVQRRKLLLLK